MAKLSEKERKYILGKLQRHMNNIESAISGIVNDLTMHGSMDINEKRRVLKLKQLLLSLRVEYNNIKLRYE